MMSKKKKPVTAAELMERLKGDPEWVRQDEEREVRHSAKAAQLRAELEPEEGPLIADLASVGYNVDSVWDLVNAKASYPAAIPVLLKHLPVARHPKLRQGIARALTVPEARGIAGRGLLEELVGQKDLPGSEERWALANALTFGADENIVESIKTLSVDPHFADVHERLNTALKNLRRRN
jgi:hypothetical protein